PVVVARDALRDVLQPVVAGDAAALLHLRDARRKVELVVHHEDFLGLDLEETGEHLYRAAARVHEALRLEQPRAGGLVAADQRLELRVLAQRDAIAGGQALDQPEAHAVARSLVFPARAAHAHGRADQGLP